MELMRCAVGWCGSHPVILNGEGTAIDPTGFPDLSLYLELSHFCGSGSTTSHIGWSYKLDI